MVFLFCLRSSVPPLIRGPFKDIFHEKHFSWTIFFLKKKFFTLFLKNLFDKFYQTIRSAIFLKIILCNQKKNTRKTVSRFLALALCTPSDNNFIQISFSRKHLFYIFFLIFSYYHHACVHPLMNHTKPINIFSKNKFQWKFAFCKIYVFFSIHGPLNSHW